MVEDVRCAFPHSDRTIVHIFPNLDCTFPSFRPLLIWQKVRPEFGQSQVLRLKASYWNRVWLPIASVSFTILLSMSYSDRVVLPLLLYLINLDITEKIFEYFLPGFQPFF